MGKGSDRHLILRWLRIGAVNWRFAKKAFPIAAAGTSEVVLHVRAAQKALPVPPDWRPMASVLLPLAIIAAWAIARAMLKRQVEMVQGADAADRVLQSRVRWAISLVVLAVGLFIAYNSMYCSWVVQSEPGANGATGTVFVLPLVPSPGYDKALAAHGGYATVVDNEQEWLLDALRAEGWRVTLTYAVLIVLGLAASVVLMAAFTVVVGVPGAEVDAKAASEAVHTG